MKEDAEAWAVGREVFRVGFSKGGVSGIVR